jgi:hypothetical protein
MNHRLIQPQFFSYKFHIYKNYNLMFQRLTKIKSNNTSLE